MNNLRKERNRRNIGVFVLVVLLAVLAYISIWKSKEVTMSVPLPVSVVSQEVAWPVKDEAVPTSTPPSIASQIEATIAEQEAKYVVRKGDVLSLVFPKDWKRVCEMNNLKSCDKIEVGQELTLPSGVETKEVIHRTAVRSTDGWLPIKKLNVDPYSRHRTPAKDRKILEGRGYLPAEIEEYFVLLEQGQCAKEPFARGTEYLWMSHGNARVIEKLRAVWSEPESGLVCQLKSGRTVVIMEVCENLAEVRSRAPLLPAIPEVTEVKEAIPPPVVAEVPAAVSEAPLPVVTDKLVSCPLDSKLVLGQEHEPSHSGNSANATFLSAAVLCTWRGETGTHGVGAGVQASWWNGTVNQGAGKFKGSLVAAGPAYEYVSDDHWDMEAKLLFGTLDESFKQGDYESSRHFGVAGPSLGYNNYQRRARGEKWLPETQVFGGLMLPFSKEATHSWQGKPIDDTSELSEFNAYFNAGVRQWIYDGEVLQPYVQLGYFLESPGAESMSFRVGVADPNRICGIGVGIDHDLISGSNANAWGWWCDVVKGVKVLRTKNRADQIVEATGNGVTAANGIIMVPLAEDTASSGTVANGIIMVPLAPETQ